MPSAGPDEAFPDRDALAGLIGHDPVARFLGDLQALGYHGGDVAVAVSGGPDSTALLLLIISSVAPANVTVATVDHGLRAEAKAEAAHVEQLCHRLGVRHATLAVTVPKMRGGLQAAAREARYAALADWCQAPWLLVAHHRDDVAETLLMRLARGSGIRGLARMASQVRLNASGPMLLRPLLAWSKADLLGVCARVGIETIRDPSNAETRFDRTLARTVLARSPWLDPKHLYRSASNIAEADADRCWHERVVVRSAEQSIEFDPVDLPHDTKRRLIERIMIRFAGHDPDRRIESLIAMLDAHQYAMLGEVQAIPGRVWTFRRAPPRRAS